jgi:hypothetical protein
MHGRRRVMNKLFCFSGNVTKPDQQTIYYHLQVLIKQILYLICSDFFYQWYVAQHLLVYIIIFLKCRYGM